MAIDITKEQILSIREARRYWPRSHSGKLISPTTIWRHASKGLPLANGTRVRLEVVRVGRGLATSVEAVSRFFTALTQNFDEVSAEKLRQDLGQRKLDARPETDSEEQRQYGIARQVSELLA